MTDEQAALQPTTALALHDVTLSFGGRSPVLHHLELDVREGEFFGIVGPSGSGKSSILNLMSGVVAPSHGSVQCYGEHLRGLNRRVSYMTQRDTLLPWRTAVDNAALPLEIAGVPRKERRQRASEVLNQLRVRNADSLRPHELSGGMRSRVALARALLSPARVLLMDEPFAAIDALQRLSLQQLLVDTWEAVHLTIVYVTHDIIEAIALCHRVAVLGAHPGRLLAIKDVTFDHPRVIATMRVDAAAERLYTEIWHLLEGELEGGDR